MSATAIKAVEVMVQSVLRLCPVCRARFTKWAECEPCGFAEVEAEHRYLTAFHYAESE